MEERHVLNLRLSDEMVTWLDSVVVQNNYSSKSEAVRNLIRNHIKLRQ